jgi:hypothetical protein
MTFNWPSFLAAAISAFRPPKAVSDVAVAALTAEPLPVVVVAPHAVTTANAANATPERANLFTCFDISLWCPSIFHDDRRGGHYGLVNPGSKLKSPARASANW